MNPFGAATTSLLVVNLVDAWLYGSLLAAVAVALTLVFGLGRVVNFAIGAFYAIGAYLAYSLQGEVGYWAAVLIAAICVTVLAGGVERIAIRPLRGRTEIATLLATFGLAILLDGLMQVVWGTATRTMTSPIRGTVPVDGQRMSIFAPCCAARARTAAWPNCWASIQRR
jgi:branched-chain amino acid transport system permease protein